MNLFHFSTETLINKVYGFFLFSNLNTLYILMHPPTQIRMLFELWNLYEILDDP